MAFCVIGKEYIQSGYTQIDNLFLGGYLPQADPTDCKIYLYGLFLATADGEDNAVERAALALRLPEERIIKAYKYWQEQGLVSISRSSPTVITYLSVKLPLTPVIKLNAREYSVFIEEVTRLFPEKVMSENELMSYVELMRETKLDTNAMLMIVRYCMNLKAAASTPYILAVAADWAKRGIISEEAVSANIAELECHNEGLTKIYQTLGLKSQPSLEDRQYFLKWTKEYNMSLDALLTAARVCKRKGGLSRLQRYVDELHEAGAVTAEEIDSYSRRKEADLKLAEDIARNIGAYYGNYDAVVETYITPWLNKGFEPDALRAIAKFCLVRNVRSLEGMRAVADKFYKLGVLTENGIASYIQKQVAVDELIKEVLSRAGATSFITNRDREFYRTFIELWGFDHNAILAAADYVAGNPFPMAALNRTLASLKNAGVFDAEEIKNFLASGNAKKQPTTKTDDDYEKHVYTKEQLNAVSHSLDELNENGGDF